MRNEVLVHKTPAVLRGVAADWPAVHAAQEAPLALVRYLERFATSAPVDALMTAPEIEGEIFYDANMHGFNFHRNRLPILQVVEQILRYARFEKAPAVAAQSALIETCLPGFSAQNRLEVLSAEVKPRIWLGNRITTPTHVDEWNNIGCVVAGRRRFTLFPPEQIENLYIGPLDFAPTGAPMSLVSLRRPDFDRFPKFRLALKAAQTVDLTPGDGLFIPPLWWHHVESQDSFNVLVNYWWHEELGDGSRADSAFEALLHGILAIRSLPAETRAAWRAFFEQYVFDAAPPGHIPPERLGLLGKLQSSERAILRQHLKERLKG